MTHVRVIVAIDQDAFGEWAEESDENARFYDNCGTCPVDVWNTVAVRYWGPQVKWLTHWMPLPEPPCQPAEQKGART